VLSGREADLLATLPGGEPGASVAHLASVFPAWGNSACAEW